MPDWIIPDWPAPNNVRALVTTRNGGISPAPWESMNLATHVDDSPERVAQNRSRLQNYLKAKHSSCQPIQWLNQIHGTEVFDASSDELAANQANPESSAPIADAITTTQIGHPIAVLTADCLPVFLCDKQGTQVAVAHAGWRGLSAGILEKTVAKFANSPDQLLAWLGPAIGPNQFEVGDEVRNQIIEQAAPKVDCAPYFIAVKNNPNHWLANLYGIARAKLTAIGITYIGGGEFCTVEQPEQFYSYRRDGQTGRMASVILLAGD